MSTVLMSPSRSLAKIASALIRLEAERYQWAALVRLPWAVKWSASSAAEPQSVIEVIGFQVAARRPRVAIHDVSRSSGAKTDTGPTPVRCRAVRRTNSSLVEVAMAAPDQVSSVGTTTVEVLPDRWTPNGSTLSSAGDCTRRRPRKPRAMPSPAACSGLVIRPRRLRSRQPAQRLEHVTSIQRVHTAGGKAPPPADCDSAKYGA